jgi:predicted nucleotidyltransferase
MAISQDKIASAVEILRRIANPRRIILFGSQATGSAGQDSDVDLLVVQDEVGDRGAELTRLYRALRPLRLPAEIVLASEERFRAWRDVPGSLFYGAAHEGKLLYEAP